MVSVLVRGFDFNTPEQQIANHMAQAGTVQSVQKVDDGSVSVTYSYEQEAMAAVQHLNQTNIAGNKRYIDVISLDPSQFLANQNIDAAKVQQFLAMTPELQHAVMARGTLATARDPTAVLVQRMKQAKCQGIGGMSSGGDYSFGGGVNVLVRGFDFDTSDDQIRNHMSSVGGVQGIRWVDQGSVCVTYSSAEEAKAATAQLQQTIIPGNSRYIDVITMDPNEFLAQHNIDADKAMQFSQMTHEQQQLVMAKGSMATARDPTAVLVMRMKEAKGGGKGSFGPAQGGAKGGNGPYGGGKGGGMGGNAEQMQMMMKMMQMMMQMQSQR